MENRGRKASGDYEHCTSVGVMIDKADYEDLKVYCIRKGLTLKKVLHIRMKSSIDSLLGCSNLDELPRKPVIKEPY